MQHVMNGQLKIVDVGMVGGGGHKHVVYFDVDTDESNEDLGAERGAVVRKFMAETESNGRHHIGAMHVVVTVTTARGQRRMSAALDAYHDQRHQHGAIVKIEFDQKDKAFVQQFARNNNYKGMKCCIEEVA